LSLIISNGDAALPGEDILRKVDIRIEGERIAEIGSDLGSDGDTLDAAGLMILPGGIDPHVHFDDPGYTDREDFYHGSCAAASGGITTVIDMPCTSIPPVTDRVSLENKLRIVERKAVVDFGLYGGVSSQSYERSFPENMIELAGDVLGYKTYFISGMDSYGRLDHYQFPKVLEMAKIVDVPVLVHAEDYEYVMAATGEARKAGDEPIHYYHSRPEIAELIGICTAIELAEAVGADLHIVHIGTAQAARLLHGTLVTGETAPHYLEYDVSDFERIGSPLKVTPVVKSSGEKSDLWDLLASGDVDFVASDHAPCSEREKHTGSIWTDYAGIPGVGTLLPYMFSEGYAKGRIGLRRLVEVTTETAARRYGIFDRKGSVGVGKDADLVFIDPQGSWTVRGEDFLSKGKITPFEGMTFTGRVMKTMVRGTIVYDVEDGIMVGGGYGRLVKRRGYGGV
jgi:allantoinase